MRNKSLRLAFVLLLMSTKCLRANAEIVVFVDGHADIGLTGTPGNYTMKIELDEIGTFAPSQVVTKVADGVQSIFSSTPLDLSPTGLVAGQPGSIWILPQVQNELYPWPGLSLGGIGGTGTGTFRLLSASMPAGGNFSLWTWGTFAPPNFWMTTADGINPIVGPGSDTVTQSIGSHSHFNFGFTAAGIYDITMDVIGTRNGIDFISAPGTFRFSVGDSTAVPEPTALGLIGMLACFVTAVRKLSPKFRNQPARVPSH
jgi:surface-anchored protein